MVGLPADRTIGRQLSAVMVASVKGRTRMNDPEPIHRT